MGGPLLSYIVGSRSLGSDSKHNTVYKRSYPKNQESEEDSSNRKNMSLEVACLCNLALACIKLGHFDSVEEACSRALHRSPACSKALFRRGQARLAVGKSVDAASDFQAAARLEPTNPEIRKMLVCCEKREGAHSDTCGGGAQLCDSEGTPVGGGGVKEQRDDDDDDHIGKGDQDDAANNIETDGRGIGSGDRSRLADWKTPPLSSSPSSSGGRSTSAKTVESEEEEVSAGIALTNESDVDAHDRQQEGTTVANPLAQDEHTSTAATEASSSNTIPGFLVSGWLSSAERAMAEKSRNEDKQTLVLSSTEVPVVGSKTSIAIDGGRAGEPEDSTSVSVLVSGLKTREAIKKRAERPKIIAQSEWLLLNKDETRKLKEFRQRLGPSVAVNVEPGPSIGAQKKKSSSRCSVQEKDALESGGGNSPLQASEWALLMEKEKQVLDVFRSKLVVGHKGKNKKNMKKKSSHRSRADCGGATSDINNGNV